MAHTTADSLEEMLREIEDKKKFPVLDFGALHDNGIQDNTLLELLDDCIADIEDELNDGKPNDQQLTKVVTQLTSVLTNQPEAIGYIDIAPNGTWGLKKQIEKLSTQDTPPTVAEVNNIKDLYLAGSAITFLSSYYCSSHIWEFTIKKQSLQVLFF